GRSDGALTEREGKHVLALYGIPTPHEALATTPEGAVAAAQTLGPPVVLKIESPDIPHKTEANGVRIGLHDPEVIGRAFGEMAADLGDVVGEIDVNPLVVLPEGVYALDCLIVPRQDGD